MDLKFYLNKFLKADGIEGYTLSSLKALRECYENFLDTPEGTDPDFPLLNFGGKKGQRLKGISAAQRQAYYESEAERKEMMGEGGIINVNLLDL